MKAEIYIVDEYGKRVNTKPILLEPVNVEDIGMATTYRFAFKFSKLNDDAFDKIMDEGEQHGGTGSDNKRP